MTPDEFKAALASLGWKQSDFCRKAGVTPNTPTRWVTTQTPIPAWVAAYLGAMQEIQRLHARFIAVGRLTRSDDGSAESEADE